MDKNIENNPNMQKGFDAYNELYEKASKLSEEMTEKVITKILKEENGDKYAFSYHVLGIAKTLTALVSYLYEDEESFLQDIKNARETVVSDVIPALINPQPCGICNNCKNGNPQECLNPNIREGYTSSRFLPIVANMLLEYDIFNKILYMHTIGKKEKE